MPVNDSLIAATTLAHGLVVVTRLRKNREPAGAETVRSDRMCRLMVPDRSIAISILSPPWAGLTSDAMSRFGRSIGTDHHAYSPINLPSPVRP